MALNKFFTLNKYFLCVLVVGVFVLPATLHAATPTTDDVRKSADCFAFYMVTKDADPSASGKADSAQGMKFTGLMLNGQAADMKLDDAGKKDIVHKAITDADAFVKAAIDKKDTEALAKRDNDCRALVMDYDKQMHSAK